MSTAATPQKTAVELGGVIPILRVNDVAASVDYYVHKLGFRVNWEFPEGQKSFFASISRGKSSLFLSAGDQGHPGSWVWIDGRDVEALHQEFVASGAKIRNPPTNYEWALEMQVEDLDGNILRFGSDNKKDEPIGSWLDMYGDRWIRLQDGSHRKLAR
jgi:predicted lactoylglutathione lyase